MKKYFALLFSGLLFAACAPETPETRIGAHPTKFGALPAKDQDLVRQGRIARGMSKDAVVLAWGQPKQTFAGYDRSKRSERWDYSATQPVFSSTYFGGFCYGSGFYGAGLGLGPQVTYIPHRVASVWFLDERVSSWERLRGGASY